MSSREEWPSEIDRLDDIYIDDWSIVAIFQTPEYCLELMARHVELSHQSGTKHNGGQFLVTSYDDIGVAEFTTNDLVTGTQQEALRCLSRRFVYILGSYATADALIKCSMNTDSGINFILEQTGYPELPTGLDSVISPDVEPEIFTMNVTEPFKNLLQQSQTEAKY